MSKFLTLARKFCASHHITIAAATPIIALFADDAYRVYQTTGHLSMTDVRGIAITIGFSCLKGLFESKSSAPATSADTPTNGATEATATTPTIATIPPPV